MRRIFVLVALSQMFVACSDNGVEVAPGTLPRPNSLVEAQRLILVRWEWVKSIYPGDLESTPASTGHTQQMIFTADGVMQVYRDGQLALTGTYEIRCWGTNYSLVWDDWPWQNFCIAGNYFSYDQRESDGCYALYVRSGAWH